MNPTHTPFLPDSPVVPPRGGVTYASVPKILLGLGALCLLVAAGTFLAVSWSSLGVGGRTAVLAALTLAALGSTVLLHRSGLRIAAEAISAVTLGLLTLDVYGAAAAGLLGDVAGPGTTLLAGALLALAGGGFGVTTRVTHPRLAAPQVACGFGIALAAAGGAGIGSGHPLVSGQLAVLAAGVLAGEARRRGLPVQQWSCLAAALPAWLGSTATAFVTGLLTPTVHQLWVAGSGWSLLASAAGLLVPAAVVRSRTALLAGASGAALVVTTAATLPVVGSSADTVVAVTIAVTAAWMAALALVRSGLRVIAIAPTALGCLLLVVAGLVVAGFDLARWTSVLHPFDQPFLVHLGGPSAPLAGFLVVPAALVLACGLAVALAGSARVELAVLLRLAVPGCGMAAALATAAYDLPLATAVGLLAVTGAGLTVAGGRSSRNGAAYAAVGLTLIGAAALGALPSAGLVAAASGTGLLAAVWLAATALARPVRTLGEVASVPAFAITVLSLLAERHVTTVEAATLPFAGALLALGLLHLRRNPESGTEALLPGLLLAIVPTAWLALGDPLSLRALLLGLGCLTLVLAGAALRWSTPLLTGAATGLLLVLCELGPYAGSVPQWVWIGSAGVLLTAAGITWERQLRDLRRMAGLIGRLR